MLPRVIWVSLALALFLGVVGLRESGGADWSVVPDISARTEFNNNIFNDLQRPRAGGILKLAPTAIFNYDTEILKLQGRLGLTGIYYLGREQRNLDQATQVIGSYKLTPLLSLNMSTGFIVDSTSQEELTTSGLIIRRTSRQSVALGPGLVYDLTERLSTTLSYAYNQVNYQSAQFHRYTTQNLTLGWKYVYSPLITLNSNIQARYIQSGTNNQTQSVSYFSGLEYKFSEDYTINFASGFTYALQKVGAQVLDLSNFPFFILVQEKTRKTTQFSPYTDIGLQRRWEKLTIKGGYRQDQSGSSLGTTVDVHSLNLKLTYALTARLNSSMGADYYLSDTTGGQTSRMLKNSFLRTPKNRCP